MEPAWVSAPFHVSFPSGEQSRRHAGFQQETRIIFNSHKPGKRRQEARRANRMGVAAGGGVPASGPLRLRGAEVPGKAAMEAAYAEGGAGSRAKKSGIRPGFNGSTPGRDARPASARARIARNPEPSWKPDPRNFGNGRDAGCGRARGAGRAGPAGPGGTGACS